MIAVHSAEPPSVGVAYDFSTAHTVVNLGGASGNMLAHILTRHAGPRGVLFELPQATAGAPALLKAKGVDDRVTIEHGRFSTKCLPAAISICSRRSFMTGTRRSISRSSATFARS